MFLLLVCLLLSITSITLVLLRFFQPEARYAWLVAAGGAAAAFIGVVFWAGIIPFEATLPAWQPQTLFPTAVTFRVDGAAWALSASITALTAAILLTAVTRPVFGNTLSWAGTLMLGGVGVLSAVSNNPLTLLLTWALLDLAEFFAQVSSVDGARNNEQAVISFATRVAGSSFLLWSYIEGFSSASTGTFQSLPSNTSLYLGIAAGLRLGVLPLHLPYDPKSSLRRGFGTGLRLIGAASTLSVLTHHPLTAAGWTPLLMLLAGIAAVYGGWMWLRAPDELNGRPYWMIGIASLAVLSALGGNPTGAAAWACILVLAGGALFLSAARGVHINRLLLVGVWGLSSLPLSLTATAWNGNTGFAIPFALAAQAAMAAGYIRFALRPGTESLDESPAWAKAVYPAGLAALLIVQVLLGLFGWEGALQTGNWILALPASLLTLGLFWSTRRFRIFSPARVHWVGSTGSGVNGIYQSLWAVYRGLARLSQTINKSLEGEGGIMWTLLFLIFFILIITGGTR